MAEYIKRKAVIDLITRRYENPEICTQEINSIPAADVVPVVRCKDCAFCENKGMSGLYCNHPDNRNPYGCRGNDFCDAGRKRKDEDLGWGIEVK